MEDIPRKRWSSFFIYIFDDSYVIAILGTDTESHHDKLVPHHINFVPGYV